MRFSEYLLTESLGNLRKLKLGALINAQLSKEGLFSVELSDFFYGPTSEIIDIGQIKSAYDLAEAVANRNDITAAAIYINGKAFMFMTFFSEEGPNAMGRTVTCIADLSAFPKEDIPNNEALYRKIRHECVGYQLRGASVSREMIDPILALPSKPILTVKLVSSDKIGSAKKAKRENEKLDDGPSLKTRVLMQKIKKAPTIKKLKDFLKFYNKDGIVKYKDIPYSTLPSNVPDKKGYSLVGYREIVVTGNGSDDDGKRNGSISLMYLNEVLFGIKMVPKFRYNLNLSIDFEVINPEVRLKYLLDIHSWPNDKEEIIKRLLTAYRAGKGPHFLQVIEALKDAGRNWPELDAIEKSLKANKAEEE